MKVAGLQDAGGTVTAGRPIARGGEGAVFELTGRPEFALKMYFTPDPLREAKVASFVHGRFGSRCPSAAVPQSIVRDSTGVFVGFTMRRVLGARPLHDLYGASSRRTHFPAADWRMVVRAAVNVACAVSEVHAAGLVIGDINHSSMLVSPRSLVTLIDTDSWQMGNQHLCRVGVPEYTPPELQGCSLNGLLRTPDHDAFGLAVLLAQLLFLGRHPFAGVPIGQPLALPDAIARHQFAFTLVRPVRLRPPPGTLLLSDLPPAVRVGFERAFGSKLGSRYSPAKWATVLSEMEGNLCACPNDNRHFAPLGALTCPWCRIERVTGRSTFGADLTAPARSSAPDDLELERMRISLDEIDALGFAQIEPPSATRDVTHSPDAAAFSLESGGAAHAALLRSVTVLKGGVSNDRFTRRHTAAELALVRTLADWRSRIGAERVLLDAAAVRRSIAHETTRGAESGRLGPCAAACAATDIALRMNRIADARIPGLPAHRRRLLAAAGVLTAADVGRSRLASIVGLGNHCIALLLVWRDEIAASSAPADAADRARSARKRLVASTEAARIVSRQRLRFAHRQLRTAVAGVLRSAAQKDAAVKKSHTELLTATADLRFLRLPLPGQASGHAAINVARFVKQRRATTSNLKTRSAGKPRLRKATKACPKCAASMVRRWGGNGARRVFLGCTLYPTCEGRRSVSGRAI